MALKMQIVSVRTKNSLYPPMIQVGAKFVEEGKTWFMFLDDFKFQALCEKAVGNSIFVKLRRAFDLAEVTSNLPDWPEVKEYVSIAAKVRKFEKGTAVLQFTRYIVDAYR